MDGHVVAGEVCIRYGLPDYPFDALVAHGGMMDIWKQWRFRAESRGHTSPVLGSRDAGM